MIFAHRSSCPEETQQLGERLGACLRGGELIFVSGALGSGKTVWLKGVARALEIDPVEVVSPSFTLMNLYPGRFPFYHFDLYRLGERSRLIEDEISEVTGRGVVAVEWAQFLDERRFAGEALMAVRLETIGETERRLEVRTVLDYIRLP